MPTRYYFLLAWKIYSQLDFRGYKREREREELEKAASRAIPGCLFVRDERIILSNGYFMVVFRKHKNISFRFSSCAFHHTDTSRHVIPRKRPRKLTSRIKISAAAISTHDGCFLAHSRKISQFNFYFFQRTSINLSKNKKSSSKMGSLELQASCTYFCGGENRTTTRWQLSHHKLHKN